MEDVALFFHLLGALMFVAGIVLVGAVFEAARRRELASEIALLLGLARAGLLLAAAGAVLVGVFGLWLIHLGGWSNRAWIDASIALYVVALALGGLGGRRPRQARMLAGRLAVQDAPASAQLRALLDDRRSRIANLGSSGAVAAILVLMVFR